MFTGSGNLALLGGIGILIGVVFAVIEGIVGGGRKLPFGGLIFAVVLYVAMFTPRVGVSVFDTYTWSGRQVDNVPLGVAAVGSVMSHVGYGITEYAEQMYSIPGMLDTGYGTPLEMLLAVRNHGLGSANHVGPNDNFLQSMANYAKDCTEVGFKLGFLDEAEVVTSPNVWSAIRFQSDLYTTEIFLPNTPPGGNKVTCNQAYSALNNQWGQRLNEWNQVLSRSYNVSNARGIMQGALDNMVQVGLDANDYMKSALTMNIVRRVDRGDYSPGMYAATLVNTQATEQARAQFAGEAGMFARFARPLMTFVEGFVYSLTPFMAFIIGFGMLGVKLIGRYLLMLMWVQLWMPILSVVNLFIDLSFMRRMDALNSVLLYTGQPLSPLSMLGMNSMQQEIADYVAVGGNLVAAAPALALAIIYGGAYSLVNMAHRLSPQDMIDEKQVAPDLMKNAGVMSMTSRATNDPLGGTRVQGADAVLGSANVATSVDQAVSSAQNQLLTSQHAYSSAVNQGVSNLMKGGVSASKLQQLGHNVSGAKGTSYGNTIETAENLATKYGFNTAQTSALKGLVTADASGAIKTPSGEGLMKFLSANLGLKSAAIFENDVDKKQAFTEDFGSLFREASSKQVQESFNDVVSATAQDSENQSWETVASEQNSQSYSESLGRVTQANKSFQAAESLKHAIGTSQNIPITALAKSMADNKETMGFVNDHLISDDPLRKRVGDRMEAMEAKNMFGDPRIKENEDRYRAAAYFQETAASAFAPGLNEHIADLRQTGLRLSLENSGYVASGAVPKSLDPRSNAGIAGSVEGDAANAVPEVQAHTGKARVYANEAEAEVKMTHERMDQIRSGIPTPDAFDGTLDKRRAEAEELTALTGKVGDAALTPQLRHLEQSDPVSTAAQLYGMASGLSEMFGITMAPGQDEKSFDMGQFLDHMNQQLVEKYGDEWKADFGLPDLQNRIGEKVVADHKDLHDRAVAAGLTDLQAQIFAYAGSRKFAATAQTIPGLDRATRGMDKVMEGLGIDTNVNVADGAKEKYYSQLHQHYMNRFDNDQELADETTAAVFNRLVNAGQAGHVGIRYLQPVAGVNMAVQSGVAGRHDNQEP